MLLRLLLWVWLMVRARVPAMRPRDALFTPTEAKAPARTERVVVYVTPDELAAIDQLRLELRKVGIKVDRGRMLRAAYVAATSDLSAFENALRRGDGA